MQRVRITTPDGVDAVAELPLNEVLLYRELAQPVASTGLASAPVAAVVREALATQAETRPLYDDLKVTFINGREPLTAGGVEMVGQLAQTALRGWQSSIPPEVQERWPGLATWPALLALADFQRADDDYRREAAQEDAMDTLARLDQLAPHNDFWGWVGDVLSVTEPGLPLDPSLREARLGWLGSLAMFQTAVLGVSPLAVPLEVTVLGDDLIGVEPDMSDAGSHIIVEADQPEVILWRSITASEETLQALGGPSSDDVADFIGDSSRPEEGGYLEISSRLGFAYPAEELAMGAALSPVAVIHRTDDGYVRVPIEEVSELAPQVTVTAAPAGGLQLE